MNVSLIWIEVSTNTTSNFWGASIWHEYQEELGDSEKVCDWATLSVHRDIGPYYIDEPIFHAESYLYL